MIKFNYYFNGDGYGGKLRLYIRRYRNPRCVVFMLGARALWVQW